MLQTVVIATGGAFGALMRFWVSSATYAMLGRSFPYGTLMVNVLGSLLMGFLFVWLTERSSLPPEWRSLILVGFLGAFTTFSTFSLETFSLLQAGEVSKALFNILLSVVLCLLATWIGVFAGRQI
ncbi:MAG: fluoride efflux transporter CrcB [Gammaproteobacteria bacterium]|nr:fluoride efflux transporter CrcB [Gammaproteobacteria bacterium]